MSSLKCLDVGRVNGYLLEVTRVLSEDALYNLVVFSGEIEVSGLLVVLGVVVLSKRGELRKRERGTGSIDVYKQPAYRVPCKIHVHFVRLRLCGLPWPLAVCGAQPGRS